MKEIGYIDVDGLSDITGKELYIEGNYDFENGFRVGFQKAMELNKTNFDESDMLAIYEDGIINSDGRGPVLGLSYFRHRINIIKQQSLVPKQYNVEVQLTDGIYTVTKIIK